MNKFCIVIPIYKEDLDCIEKVSLTQLWKVIGGKHYHIYFVRPKKSVIFARYKTQVTARCLIISGINNIER